MTNEQTVMGVEEIKAALDGTSGRGLDMLPVPLANEIIGRVWEESWCRQMFRSYNMTSDTMDISKLTDGMTVYGKGKTDEGATESRHATTKITLSLETIIGNGPVEKKLIAYAIDALMPSIEDDIVNKFSETEEDMFINGDTETGSAYASNINGAYNAVNYPLGISSSRDPRLLFDGLRKKAIDGGTSVNASGQALSQTHIRKAFNALGRYGKKKSDIIILCSLSVSNTILGWDDLRQLRNYGPGATILTGEIGEVFGCKVIATDLVPDTLGDTGVARSQATTTDNRSVVLVFNKTSPVIGNPAMAERKFKIALYDDIINDEIHLVPIEDVAFNCRYNEAICYIYNVLPGVS